MLELPMSTAVVSEFECDLTPGDLRMRLKIKLNN